MSTAIQQALSQLDPNNDNHWTQDGSPRIETVKFLSGDPSITREVIASEFPNFNRAAAAASATETPAQAQEETPAVVTETAPEVVAQAEAPLLDAEADNKVEELEPEFDNLEVDDLNATSIETLERTLTSVQNQISVRTAERTEIQHKLDALIQKEAEIDELLYRAKGKNPSNNAVIEYLAAQTKHEAEKAETLKQLKESGALDVVEQVKKLVG